ncbi:uncharacterized protein LOC106867382 [Octopus bimaculoides]|uniref:uncharacterized protein LOC106867382 n=1 Tax=Octopus bimaculoides TaxID=37653 RepID=UPI00071CE86D|nr:uncharacterized protein LOC106867382 [Octopus bimaculoides]|eukprot:XP_014767724.1 PREDICTED: uncharacterized protein LOC106867382 [Octopus bimaculoides]
MWNQNLQDGYVPSSCRGRYPFLVYIPSKPGKCGITIWAIGDCEISYAWKIQVSTGKNPVKWRETYQGSRVVEELVKELENTGRNRTCDNVFTNLGFAQKLLSKKTTLVGTIRKNRVELPSDFTNGKKEK